jgi:hypothetical protein
MGGVNQNPTAVCAAVLQRKGAYLWFGAFIQTREPPHERRLGVYAVSLPALRRGRALRRIGGDIYGTGLQQDECESQQKRIDTVSLHVNI